MKIKTLLLFLLISIIANAQPRGVGNRTYFSKQVTVAAKLITLDSTYTMIKGVDTTIFYWRNGDFRIMSTADSILFMQWNTNTPLLSNIGGSSHTFFDGDFNVSGANVVTLDYTNGQAASGAQNGFLSSTNWNTFNNKASLTAAQDFSGANIFSHASGLTIGKVGVSRGLIKVLGSISGTVSIEAKDDAGTYNFNLPTTAGTSGQVLTSAGGGSAEMTWTTKKYNPYGSSVGFILTQTGGDDPVTHNADNTTPIFNEFNGTTYIWTRDATAGTYLCTASTGVFSSTTSVLSAAAYNSSTEAFILSSEFVSTTVMRLYTYKVSANLNRDDGLVKNEIIFTTY